MDSSKKKKGRLNCNLLHLSIINLLELLLGANWWSSMLTGLFKTMHNASGGAQLNNCAGDDQHFEWIRVIPGMLIYWRVEKHPDSRSYISLRLACHSQRSVNHQWRKSGTGVVLSGGRARWTIEKYFTELSIAEHIHHDVTGRLATSSTPSLIRLTILQGHPLAISSSVLALLPLQVSVIATGLFVVIK